MSVPEGAGRTGVQSGSPSVHGLILLFVAVGFLVVMWHDRLPERFGTDARKIYLIANGLLSVEDKHFSVTADAYRFINLGEHPQLAGFLGFLCYSLVLILLSGAARVAGKIEPFSIALLAASVFLGAVYLGQYSKELFVLPVMLAVGLSDGRRSLHREMVSVAALLVYADLIRTYWFVVATVYVGARLLIAYRFRLNWLAAYVIATLVSLAVFFQIYLGQDLTYFRAYVNAGREGTYFEATTAIHDLLPLGGVLGNVANAFLVMATLVVPVTLAAIGPVYAAVALFVATLWIRTLLLGRWYVNSLREGGIRDHVVERTLALALAVVLVQSLFESDYGSYVRHLTPMLPLIAAAILRIRKLQASSGSAQAAQPGNVTGEVLRPHRNERTSR